MLHGHNDIFRRCHEIHRAAHSFDHSAWNFPVGNVPAVADLHRSENSELNVLATNHGEAQFAREEARPWHGRDGLLTRIDQVCIFFAFEREGPHAQDAVLTLKFYIDALRDVVRH